MNRIKAIRTEQDYQEALELLETLMDQAPAPDSEAADRLNILAVLIENYEADHFSENLPSAVDAIKFRMDQKDLKPVDLVPYLGSPSRVSEILAGKRPLTIEMIRALERGLGIPAKVLIQRPERDEDAIYRAWDSRVYTEMTKRGYFNSLDTEADDEAGVLKKFFSQFGASFQVPAFLRQSSYRSAPNTDKYALAAWSAHVLKTASKMDLPTFKPESLNLETMQELAKLSVDDKGPILAKKYLEAMGIALIIEPVFPRTRLDGAAIFAYSENPVIGLTLRHDRLDGFWFTLMHELAHVVLHRDNKDFDQFLDELDDLKGVEHSALELEADRLASEALVPASKWEVSPARVVFSPMAAMSLAREVGVHVAVVAGKMRYESKKWTYLNKLTGEARVQKYFPEVNWS